MGVSPAVAPPPGNPRFPLFDSLRAVAVLAVIAFHVALVNGSLAEASWGDLANQLSQGVNLFFVISGFLLYRPFAAARLEGRQAPRVRRYARRRALRIIPAYWVAITLLAIWPGLYGVFTGDWWIYYFFLQGFDRDTYGLGINVAWSLTVEVCFYALLPLWAAAMAWFGSGTRRGLGIELAILAGLVAIQFTVIVLIAAGDLSQYWSVNIAAKAGYFAVGMALALASIRLTGTRPRAVRLVDRVPGLLWLGGAACLFVLGLRPGGERGPFLVRPQEGLGAALEDTVVVMTLSLSLVTLLVLPAVFGDPDRGLVRRVLAARPLSWVGTVSYGAYLWHYAVAALILTTTAGTSSVGLGLSDDLPGSLLTPISLLIVLAVTLVIAALSYYLVELPFLRRKEPGAPEAGEPAGERAGVA